MKTNLILPTKFAKYDVVVPNKRSEKKINSRISALKKTILTSLNPILKADAIIKLKDFSTNRLKPHLEELVTKFSEFIIKEPSTHNLLPAKSASVKFLELAGKVDILRDLSLNKDIKNIDICIEIAKTLKRFDQEAFLKKPPETKWPVVRSEIPKGDFEKVKDLFIPSTSDILVFKDGVTKKRIDELDNIKPETKTILQQAYKGGFSDEMKSARDLTLGRKTVKGKKIFPGNYTRRW